MPLNSGDGGDRRDARISRCAARRTPPASSRRKREERTTEGGLDAAGGHNDPSAAWLVALSEAGIRVSLFIEPDNRQLDAARALGAPGRGTAHGRLLRGSACRRRDSVRPMTSARRIEEAAASRHLRSGWKFMPVTGWATTRWRTCAKLTRSGGTEHRSFPDRRSDFHRPGRSDQ